VISPLLSNIALNGIEKVIGDWAENQRLYRPNGKLIDSKKDRRKSVIFVRFADDFRVMNHDFSVIEKCKEIIGKFLAERGLEFSEAKTKIVHTRIPYKGTATGFEFLGFKVKHFNTIKHSAKDNKGRNIGFRLLIFPSMKSRKKHFATVDSILRRYRYAKQSWIIRKLNPVIIGWTNYFRFSHFLTTKIAATMEQTLFNKLKYWGKRNLNSTKKSMKPYDKFWHKIDGRRMFAFRDREGKYISISLYRSIAKGVSLVKYVKVKGEISIYDGNLEYWSRRAITPSLKTRTKSTLLKRQNYKCLACGSIFLPTDIIETDHIKPIARGGSHKITNLQLLHAACHDKKK
jgi:RNA-directed DNA polymerase